ncbi:hypothetical protein JCM1393_05020 [Clostridium carnis]
MACISKKLVLSFNSACDKKMNKYSKNSQFIIKFILVLLLILSVFLLIKYADNLYI